MSPAAAATHIDEAFLRTWPLPSAEGSQSKEDRGRVLVIAGSPYVPGAALLAGEASLRAGAGKLALAVPQEVALALGVALPEAKVLPLPTTPGGACTSTAAMEHTAARADAVLIGPGMDDMPALQTMLKRLSTTLDCPLVADAGASASFRTGHAFTRVPILTPHAGEMAALIDVDIEQVQSRAPEIALQFATNFNVLLVLKGPITWISAPDGRLWVHRGGCRGLGTSGSGDVLAGLIAGLVARGAPPDQAAAWGVWLHGRAGELRSAQIGSVGFFARELADKVPALLDQIAVPSVVGP